MKEMTPERARQLRRRHKHERQAVIFGGLVAGLALTFLGATAVYTGAMDADFLARDFTTPTPDFDPSVQPAPCPPEGAISVAYASVQINVLNATTRSGLAGMTAETLTERGFTVLRSGNYDGSVPGTARIHFGEAGLAAAYTLAATIPDAVLVLDQREDESVDLLLGDKWDTLIPREEVALGFQAPLVGSPSCVPLEQALLTAPAGPVPPTTQPPADGEVPAGEVPEGEVPEGTVPEGTDVGGEAPAAEG